MSDTDEPIATLAYATPGLARPRAGATLWISAAFVWIASVPAAAVCLAAWVACLATLQPLGVVVASMLFVATAGVAWLEWRAIFGRSISAAEGLCAIAAIVTLVSAAIGFIAMMAIAFDPKARAATDAWMFFVGWFGLTAIALLAAVAHGRWATRLRAHQREEAR